MTSRKPAKGRASPFANAFERSGSSLASVRKVRCAVYTRKSSEEGLDMDFNSLDAQRESCEAYIVSQRAEGWTAVSDHYDDGGFSGGTLERPALKRLLTDVKTGKIDVIVVYKIDRLSRSMLDFLNLVELFESHGVTFVSVTQSFNTKDAMGRMALNILVTFAQFERELIGERIRDKVAASRKRGKWMGGWTPLGYEVRDRKLLVHEVDAERVRAIFRRFVQLKSATRLARELVAANERNRYGHLLDKGVLYKILHNRVYLGEAVHKGTSYPGEHEAIIDRKLWDQVHTILKVSPRKRAGNARAQTPAILKGLLFGPDGAAMSPTHTRKSGRLYRYYISQTAMKQARSDCPVKSVPAAELERIVVDQVRQLLQTPEVIVHTWRALRKQSSEISEAEVRGALLGFDELWDELFPAEQARIVELLVERIDMQAERMDITLNVQGLTSLSSELQPHPFQQATE
ncbi:recombinase family protein [Bradyrhizobium sp. MOS003]|uniref:recombinase family protein n=2 Tax=Bradyrhizobium TaxID=374 RepID=UPI000D134C08|nr:recombinase family protein [Bradyrhizobium sp. MOS003]PSO19528.1 resolvase [Bradyrhizobium sp. MOS003]QDP27138.1 recombinase family protein [Bradyrhizobium cosmicum]